jgi:trimethylamine---corrinoid protein Co-methyltransferase
MSGANYIGESAGMMGSLMGCSFEAMVIDNDMIGNVQRALRGIEVNKDTLSVDVIRQSVTGEGPGHFLHHPQTLELMETEYLYPSLADRGTCDEWQANGSKDIVEVAHGRVKSMLKDYYPEYIDPKTDKKIREAFPQINLKPEQFKAGNGRW